MLARRLDLLPSDILSTSPRTSAEAIGSASLRSFAYDVNDLKEGAKVSLEYNDISEEQSRVEGDGGGMPQRPVEQKIRKCLICKAPFLSAWAGERICRRCKSTSRWRSGALG
jgi:hypothetical protein